MRLKGRSGADGETKLRNYWAALHASSAVCARRVVISPLIKRMERNAGRCETLYHPEDGHSDASSIAHWRESTCPSWSEADLAVLKTAKPPIWVSHKRESAVEAEKTSFPSIQGRPLPSLCVPGRPTSCGVA